MDPIIKAFDIGIETINGEVVVSDRDLCRLEVVKLNTSKRSAKAIANDVAAVFGSYFDPTLMSLGGTFDHSGLISELLTIDGVDRLITRRTDTNESFNGLSLYYWNPSFPDLDKKSITNNFTLLDFECYYFEGLANILNKIDIVETTSFV